MEHSSPFWSAVDNTPHSPFTVFSARAWSALTKGDRSDLSEQDVRQLRSIGDAISLAEVDHIYLAVSRLLEAHVASTRTLYSSRAEFLPNTRDRTPFIIGIAGSVAVGKSTTARVVQSLLQQWPGSPKVDLITTDGFLWPNAELTNRNIMHRKGFPESYDRARMLQFLSDVKSGKPNVTAPVYSHLKYDIDPDQTAVIQTPDILIFEGLNVLQPPTADTPTALASDFFDFSIYVDAAEADVKAWYINRFLKLRETAFSNPASHFSHYASLSDTQAVARATELWDTINAVNLRENIRPTRPRADLILRKGADHLIKKIALRRL